MSMQVQALWGASTLMHHSHQAMHQTLKMHVASIEPALLDHTDNSVCNCGSTLSAA